MYFNKSRMEWDDAITEMAEEVSGCGSDELDDSSEAYFDALKNCNERAVKAAMRAACEARGIEVGD